MNNIIPEKLQIQFYYVSKRIRILTIAIMVGLFVVFGMGLFVSGTNIHPEYETISLVSLIICVLICLPSKTIKNKFLKKVNQKNFLNAYFNAAIIPLGLCDFAGLFCVTTNLFVNQNLYYAAAGLIISTAFIFLSSPNQKDLDFIDMTSIVS